MPALQNDVSLSSSVGSCASSISASEILQKHSINSLLDQHDILSNECETMSSISDLLGLNSPRGLLNFGYSQSSGYCTPTSSYSNYQFNFDDVKYCSTPSKHSSLQSLEKPRLERFSSSSGTSGNIRAIRSTSMSDSCGCSSPVVGDRSYLRNNTRSDSSEESDRSNVSSPDENFAEILNSLTLNDSLGRNHNNLNETSELDLNTIQNLQAIQALKYLQQQPSSILGSLLPSTAACSHKQILENQFSPLFNVLPPSDVLHLDKTARYRRSTASLYEATCTWSGVLPQRTVKPTGYSCKVFLGGVPWDISEQLLIQTFRQFGPIRVEWPGKEKQASQPKGYVYIIFESEKNVRALLQACTNDNADNGNWYFKISSKRLKAKEVQVIPWILNDSSYTKSTSQKLDPSKSVFVGALHGVLNAEGLAKIMNDLFDGVVYAGIDTDKYKYPIGSGRITFDNNRSYMKAVAAAYVEIKTEKFTKKIQVDPYLEDSLCSLCGVQQGPYFCRDVLCYRYLCRTCWQWQHNNMELRHHKPLTRNSKNSTVLGLNNNNNNSLMNSGGGGH